MKPAKSGVAATLLLSFLTAVPWQWRAAAGEGPQSYENGERPVDAGAAQQLSEALLRKVLGAAEGELVGSVVELTDGVAKPLPDVKVLVWEEDEYKIRTDANGLFHAKVDITQEADKHLLLRFVKPGYATHLEADWHVGHRQHPIAFMGRDTWIEGIVRRPGGKPAADVLVRANQGPVTQNPSAVVEHLWVEARSDAEGRYKLLVDPGWYAIEIRAAGVGTARIPKPGSEIEDPQPDNDEPEPALPKLLVRSGEHRQRDILLERGVDFRAKLVDSVTVSPIEGARLWHWQYPDIEGHSDAKGMVTIPSMPAGEFMFMIQASGYVGAWSDAIPNRWKELAAESQLAKFPLDEGVPLDLTTDMQVVTIRLEPGVTVSGRVLDPNGLPVAGATVAPARTGTGRSLTGDTRYSVSSQNDGTFVAILPASGEEPYNLMVHDGEYGKWRRWANGIGEPFTAAPGQRINNIELRLASPGVVRGRVVDEQGRPEVGVYVQTTAGDRREQNYYNPGTRSAADGCFELPYVRPGKHVLHGWMGLSDKEQDDFTFPEVDVKAGETTDAGDVVIPPRFRG